MSERFDLTIIGAGPGGYEAAFEAARLGFRTALVEKDTLGGTCLNRGCIPTKTLIHTAELYEEIKNAAHFGIHAEPPVLDWNAVRQHKTDTIAALQKGIAARLKAAKVAVYQGSGSVVPGFFIAGEGQPMGPVPVSGEAVHRVLITAADGSVTTLETERVLLATGSVPAVPPIPGHDLPGVMMSDELLAYDGAPLESLLIIGGGVIGVEFAGIWQSFGTKITILEALPSLIANLDRELSQSLKLSLKKKGADIHTGANVQCLSPVAGGICCTYLEKEQEQTCTAQAVLIATGRRPFTEGLFPEATETAPARETPPPMRSAAERDSGAEIASRFRVAMERGRILVDDDYETSIPGIYAIGDVIGKLPLAHAATAQGKKAVRHMAGKEDGNSCEPVPSCIYTSPEIASVGLTLEQAKNRGIAARSHKILSSANGKSVLTMQERGFIKVVYEEQSHVLLGAHMFCARATDMISEFALAIQRGLTMEEMAEVVRPHPSFSEMITDAVTSVPMLA